MLTVLLEGQIQYSKACVKPPLKNRQNKDLMTNGSLIKLESIAKYSTWSICNTFDLH